MGTGKTLQRFSSGTLENIRGRLAAFMGYSHEGERDLYGVFGYPRTIQPEEYYSLYKRNDIANRIVKAFPQATWRDLPSPCDESEDEVSDFEDAYNDFCERWDIQSVLERADRVASIGHYGLLVMGFDDGLDPRHPLTPGKHKLLYLQPYGEYNIEVSQWNTDPKSPRFGRPELFNVRTGQPEGRKQSPMRTVTVHWTRCIHISEYLDEDDVYGSPRLEAVYNRIKDIEKVVGGGAEGFWLNSSRGMAYLARDDVQLSPEEITQMQAQAEDFQHQLRRYLVGNGIDIQPLGVDVADPGPILDKLLDLVAGTVAIPKRILIGSERGELASGQDENNWSQRVTERRVNYAGPLIMRPFLVKMIATGNLPEPMGKWRLEWPDAGALGPQQEAEVGKLRTEALAAYTNAMGADVVVPVNEFRERFLGLEPLEDEELAEAEELLDLIPDDTVDPAPQEGEPSDTLEPQEGSGNPFKLLRAV